MFQHQYSFCLGFCAGIRWRRRKHTSAACLVNMTRRLHNFRLSRSVAMTVLPHWSRVCTCIHVCICSNRVVEYMWSSKPLLKIVHRARKVRIYAHLYKKNLDPHAYELPRKGRVLIFFLLCRAWRFRRRLFPFAADYARAAQRKSPASLRESRKKGEFEFLAASLLWCECVGQRESGRIMQINFNSGSLERDIII